MTEEMPPIIKQAASRIAGVALGPFIMGQRHVDLDELEARIIKAVEKEMQALASSLLVALYKHTDVLKDVPAVEQQLRDAEKRVKSQKRRADTTATRKTSKT